MMTDFAGGEDGDLWDQLGLISADRNSKVTLLLQHLIPFKSSSRDIAPRIGISVNNIYPNLTHLFPFTTLSESHTPEIKQIPAACERCVYK